MRFSTLVFLTGTPGSPDSWAKAVLNIDSNCRSNSIRFDAENRLRAMLHSAESIFLLDNRPFFNFFYCHMVDKIIYAPF
jgi:hypothetical protein